MLGDLILPQSEVIRAILLEYSPPNRNGIYSVGRLEPIAQRGHELAGELMVCCAWRIRPLGGGKVSVKVSVKAVASQRQVKFMCVFTARRDCEHGCRGRLPKAGRSDRARRQCTHRARAASAPSPGPRPKHTPAVSGQDPSPLLSYSLASSPQSSRSCLLLPVLSPIWSPHNSPPSPGWHPPSPGWQRQQLPVGRVGGSTGRVSSPRRRKKTQRIAHRVDQLDRPLEHDLTEHVLAYSCSRDYPQGVQL